MNHPALQKMKVLGESLKEAHRHSSKRLRLISLHARSDGGQALVDTLSERLASFARAEVPHDDAHYHLGRMAELQATLDILNANPEQEEE